MNVDTRDTLNIENLSFSYPGYPGIPEKEVFRGLSAVFPGNTFTLILGSPESGKTTLSRILSSLVPRHTGGKLTGRISLPGRGEGLPGPAEMTGYLGMAFQNADEQILATRCDDEVAFALESMGVPRPEMTRRVADALEVMGLSGFTSRNPARFSGGEKKKLLLACLIAVNPRVWILDETLEEIDPAARKAFLDLPVLKDRLILMFSSRYSRPYRERFSSLSLLSGGGITGPSDPAGAEAIVEAAGREGLVLQYTRQQDADSSGGGELLAADSITYAYPGNNAFSLDISGFSLREGEVLCLLGPNGCGKSTLGRILCGLTRPDSGMVRIGEGSREAEPEELQRHVGYMFQNPDYQIFLPSVREELVYGLGSPAAQEDFIRRTADLFGLGDLSAPPALLSYGTRKRLQAACYYLLRRSVYILDEADSGLSYGDFFRILENLSDKRRGIVIITHDEDLARAVAHRILVMKAGRIISEYSRESGEIV